MASEPRLVRLSATTAALAAGTNVVLQFGAGGNAVTKVEVVRCKLKRQSGTGANFTPAIFSAVAAAVGDIEQEFQGSATAVATLFDPVVSGVFCYTDALGRLYLRPTPDAGADNVFKYHVVAKVWT